MFAESLFHSLNVLYFIFMGLVSLAGTAVLLKLMLVFLRDEPRRGAGMDINVEDA